MKRYLSQFLFIVHRKCQSWNERSEEGKEVTTKVTLKKIGDLILFEDETLEMITNNFKVSLDCPISCYKKIKW